MKCAFCEDCRWLCDAPEWQAIEATMPVVELGGPTMFARIGVVRALNRPRSRI
jgi:hypothetical protein